MPACYKTICFTLAFIFSIGFAGSQDVKWNKMLGSDKEEYVLCHSVDLNGNIYIAGRTRGNLGGKNAGMFDAFIIKLNSSGEEVWTEQFGTEGDEDLQWSATDNAGNIFVTGFTTGSLAGKNSGKEDIIIAGFRPDGKLNWQKQLGTDSSDVAKGICTDPAGNIYITGVTGGKMGTKSIGKNDCFIIKLDNKGNVLKTLQFGTDGDDFGYSVVTGTNSDIYVCGTTWGNLGGISHGMVDGFTGKFNTALENPVFRQFGTEGFDIPLVICANGKNEIYVAGSTSGNLASEQLGEGDCFILKFDAGGNEIWKRQFGSSHHDGVRGICTNDAVSDNIFVSGILNLPPENAFMRIYNRDGEMMWEKIIQAPGTDGGTSGKNIAVSNQGFITHIGLTGVPVFGPIIGEHDLYIIRLSLDKFRITR